MNKISETKIALITGITGQDGSYLCEFLLNKGYHVHGLVRPSSDDRLPPCLKRLRGRQGSPKGKLSLHYGDLSDGHGLHRLLESIKPDEIYNLAAMSHVGLSFDLPEYTAQVDGLGVLRLLESVRQLGWTQSIRFYQASSSELFGQVKSPEAQNENTPFRPRSPYAIAKLYAYWTTVNYREAYGMYACNGILFNHESTRRGQNFVSRKITRAVTRLALGLQEALVLGNLEARRDWGHAEDYVKMQWLMLQQKKPEDYVIATGIQHSVRDFVNASFAQLGLELKWQGQGLDETGIIQKDHKTHPHQLKPGMVVVKVHPGHYRPTEVNQLVGDARKAHRQLGWVPERGFDALVAEMVAADWQLALDESKVRKI